MPKNIKNEILANGNALSHWPKALLDLQMAESYKSSSESSVDRLMEEAETLEGILQTVCLLPVNFCSKLVKHIAGYQEEQVRTGLLLQSSIKNQSQHRHDFERASQRHAIAVASVPYLEHELSLLQDMKFIRKQELGNMESVKDMLTSFREYEKGEPEFLTVDGEKAERPGEQ